MNNRSCCPYNQEKLAIYASGNASNQERVEVERHLAQCPECRRELIELQNTWLALDLWPDEAEKHMPRLYDLQQKIEEIKKEESLWDKIRGFWPLHSSPGKLVPTAATIGILALLLFLPFIQSQFTGISPIESGSNDRIANDIIGGTATPVPVNNIVKEKELSDQFAKALSRSERDARDLEKIIRVIPNLRIDEHNFTNVGFSPNVVYPAQDNYVEKVGIKPHAYYQMNSDQTIRLDQ